MLIYVKLKRSKHTLSFDTLIIRRKKICQFVGMKLDHRNYLDLNEKTILSYQGLQLSNCRKVDTRKPSLVKMREDLSSGFPTMQDSNQPTQLQRLARMLKFCV